MAKIKITKQKNTYPNQWPYYFTLYIDGEMINDDYETLDEAKEAAAIIVDEQKNDENVVEEYEL